MDFGYSYKGLMAWILEGKGDIEGLRKAISESLEKRRNPLTTTKDVQQIDRVLDVLYVLLMIKENEEMEESDDCEGDPQ